MPASAQLLIALIGGGGIGGFVVAWWNHRTTTQDWMRDRRLDAYAQFAQGATALNGAFANFLNASTVDKSVERHRFDNALYELDGAFSRVALIGDKFVAGAAVDFLDHTM